MTQPTIETSRLILRPFRLDDAVSVQRLAGEREIADTTLNVPHPYEDGMAELWIATHGPGYEAGSLATFAIETRDGSQLIGAIGLKISTTLGKGELGYWVGKPFWNMGYATEAAGAVLAFGFDDLQLDSVHAMHLARNPASGRVMEKIGMFVEETARQDVMKWGRLEDLVGYAIPHEEWVKR
jgi:RimJ/RimL family protein N-acetyltransferase